MANYKSAISVCTSDTMKALKVKSKTKVVKGEDNIIYGGDTYSDLRTYNDEIDSTGNRTKEVCKEVSDRELNKKVAYPLCSTIAGPGFIRSTRDLSKCVAFDCPPEWDRDGDICRKPLKDAIIDKRSHCDERWYDWIVIPNYHIGNKVSKGKQEGICYGPCNIGNIPAYIIDPLLLQVDDPTDKDNVMNINNNIVDRCISKTNFMMGKYEYTPEFCPLAWVFRIHYKTPIGIDDLKDKLRLLYNNYKNKNKKTKNDDNAEDDSLFTLNTDKGRYEDRIEDHDTTVSNYLKCKDKTKKDESGSTGTYSNKLTEEYDNLMNDFEITKRAMEIIDSIGEYLDNIPELFDQASCDACNSLSTEERLTEAYNICKKYYESPEYDDGSVRVNILKQSCNALFNDTISTKYKSNAFDLLPNISPISFTTRQVNDKEISDLTEEKEQIPKPINTQKENNALYKSLIKGCFIILIPIMLILLYISYKEVIYPYILEPIINFIKSKIFGLPEGLIAYTTSIKQQIEEEKVRKYNQGL
jgi:hypothetical protein